MERRGWGGVCRCGSVCRVPLLGCPLSECVVGGASHQWLLLSLLLSILDGDTEEGSCQGP